MLSRRASGIGLLWCLLFCLTAVTWVDTLWYLPLAASGIVSVGWAAVLVREKHGGWLLAALPLGALVGTVLFTARVYGSDESGEYHPEIAILAFVVVLGVPFVVGVAIGYLWRYAARRHKGDPALPATR